MKNTEQWFFTLLLFVFFDKFNDANKIEQADYVRKDGSWCKL